ncbi:MAG TPA: DUF4169 family protein [Alphaproteobacteria bacterium]|nr:DUF4169 family protein [Alphaproteobacteria bacterium]
MADIVNLRRRRKQKVREAADVAAAANRARFGRPKAERDREKAEAERARTEIDNKKLTGPWSD